MQLATSHLLLLRPSISQRNTILPKLMLNCLQLQSRTLLEVRTVHVEKWLTYREGHVLEWKAIKQQANAVKIESKGRQVTGVFP